MRIKHSEKPIALYPGLGMAISKLVLNHVWNTMVNALVGRYKMRGFRGSRASNTLATAWSSHGVDVIRLKQMY